MIYEYSLNDSVILITGAGSGIGEATAIRFARLGAVAVLAGRKKPKLKKVADNIEQSGGRSYVVDLDICNQSSVRSAIRTTLRQFGKIDVVINNAGIALKKKLLHQCREQDWVRCLDVNLTGHFRVIQAVLPHFLRRRRGIIVNVSSISAIAGVSGIAAYAAAKAGLIALTRSVAIEYAPWGIYCSCVCPGMVATQMTHDYIATRRSYGKSITTGVLSDVLSPDEIASGILFLCSEGAATTTGGVLMLDGGFTAF